MDTKLNLNILPLGYYDLLIGMDWLENNLAIINCCDKTFSCLHYFGKNRTRKGIPQCVGKTDLWLHSKINAIKGCDIYDHISKNTE